MFGSAARRETLPRGDGSPAGRHAAPPPPLLPPLFALINAIGFLDLFGVSLVVPLLHHHLTTQLEASHLLAGLLGSVYGFLQLFSSPLVGRWSDTVGCRRRCLVLCLLFSAAGYFIQGLAVSPVGMIVARALLGVSKHTQSLSRGLLSVTAPRPRRPVLLGRFNAVSGLGFVVGPACAGIIAERPGGFAVLSFLCATLFLINAGIVCLFLPDPDTGTEQRAQTSVKLRAETTTPRDAPLHRDGDPARGAETPSPEDDDAEEEDPSRLASRGWRLHAVRFLMSCAFLLHHGALASWLRARHDAPPRLVGALVSLSAAAGAAASSLSHVYDAGRSPEATLRVTCAAAAAALLALASSIGGLPGATACAVALSVSSAVGRVVLTEGQLRVAGRRGAGAALGLGQAVTSAARVLAPTLGGAAQQGGGAAAPAMLGAACALIATAATPGGAPAPKTKRG